MWDSERAWKTKGEGKKGLHKRNRIQEEQDFGLTRQYSDAFLGNGKRGRPDKLVKRGCLTLSSLTDRKVVN